MFFISGRDLEPIDPFGAGKFSAALDEPVAIAQASPEEGSDKPEQGFAPVKVEVLALPTSVQATPGAAHFIAAFVIGAYRQGVRPPPLPGRLDAE